MPNTPELMTAAEVAERAKVHTETVRRWTRDGALASVKLPNGRLRYRTSDVDALLETTAGAS